MRRAQTAEELLNLESYAVYRQCMYRPTQLAFEQTVRRLIREGVHIYMCTDDEDLVGLIALKPLGGAHAEIVGIAVREGKKNQGAGRFMVREAANQMRLRRITAETDEDAIGFYRRIGFESASVFRTFPNGTVVRYPCDLWL